MPATDATPFDLTGHHILFVGGRRHHAAHFRQLVEACNGEFTHHDGGMEDNMRRLPGLFNQADAVLFPVSCVSHAAQDEVKRQCRRHEIPYMPLRSSGVGAFVQALEVYCGRCARPQ